MDYFRKYHFCRFYYGSHLRKAEEGRGKREGEGARGAPFDSFQSKLDINLTIFSIKSIVISTGIRIIKLALC